MENYKEELTFFKNPRELNASQFMRRSTVIIKKNLSKSKKFKLKVRSIEPYFVGGNNITIKITTRRRNEIIVEIMLDKNTCKFKVQMNKKVLLKNIFYFIIKKQIKRVLGSKRRVLKLKPPIAS